LDQEPNTPGVVVAGQTCPLTVRPTTTTASSPIARPRPSAARSPTTRTPSRRHRLERGTCSAGTPATSRRPTP
jgi:hypothetical protein